MKHAVTQGGVTACFIMRRAKVKSALILCLVIIFCLSVSTLSVDQATAAGDAWKVSLKLQLKKEKQCEIKSLSRVKEFKLAGKDVVDGRAHCMDGTDYDFSWKSELNKFDLRRCQPAVC